LTTPEAEQVKAMVAEANKTLTVAEADSELVVEEEGTIRIAVEHPVLSTYGYGYSSVKFYWWGVRVWLNRDDTRNICVIGVGAASALVSLIPGIGYATARIIIGALAMAVCQVGIQSGIWFDFNLAYLRIVAEGWQ